MYKDIEKRREAWRRNSKRHYWANPEAKRAKNLVIRNRQIQRDREYIKSVKDMVSCVDCGVAYPHYVMQFDHTSDDKSHNISDMVSDGKSIKSIDEEIAKCEIVCANCHFARTFNRRRGVG